MISLFLFIRMARKVEFVIVAFLLLRTVSATTYRSQILNQRVIHYDNPYVGFDVEYFGDEGYPYMILKDTITPYNDLHLILFAKMIDQQANLFVNAPMSVCQLLHDKDYLKNHTLSKLNLPQIYNFEGKHCPIKKGRIQLSPYIFPSEFDIDVDLECGYMNVESRLLKCNDGIGEDNRMCLTLMKTVSVVYFGNDKCETKSSVDGWILNKVNRFNLSHIFYILITLILIIDILIVFWKGP